MEATRTQPPWIAELRVIMVHPDGTRVPGHIAVGQPYTLAGGDPTAGYESLCSIEIDSLHSSRHPIHGGGTLQALLLAVQFLGAMLHSFIARGGRVLDADDGTDVPLSALFGPMLCKMKAPEDP